MKTVDKIKFLNGKSWWETVDFKDENIPSVFMSDGPHGLRVQKDKQNHLGLNESLEAVAYPTESTIANSFDVDLLYEYGAILGKDALYKDVDMVLGPGLNIKRNPLCGRNFEYYSEDAVVSGKLAASFINGLKSVGVSACPKHYCCNNIEMKRNFSDSRVDKRALKEVYLKGFKIMIEESDPAAIMCSYNLVNGERVSESHYLLTDVLRDEFKFNGIVVSDWGAVHDRKKCLLAGLDLAMPGGTSKNFDNLNEAINKKVIKEEDLDVNVSRMNKFISSCIDNRKNKELYNFSIDEAKNYSIKAARESCVLLKNHCVFPLKKSDKILVVGKIAKEPHYQGGGSSHVNSKSASSIYNSLNELGFNFDYEDGYDLNKNIDFNINTKGYDKIIFIVGNGEIDESEGFDRTTLSLPKCIINLIKKNKDILKKSALVIFTGGVVTIPFENRFNAIMYAGLPGVYGAKGVCEVMAGLYSPCAKLAETWINKESDAVAYSLAKSNSLVVDYNEGVFVGYKYYEAKGIKVKYPFSSGLSYTKFKYSNCELIKKDMTYHIVFDISNIGNMDAKEISFVFLNYPLTDELMPLKSLVGFKKVFIKSKESQKVHIEIKEDDLKTYDKDGKLRLINGEYEFLIGSSIDNISFNLKFKIKGEKKEITTETLIRDIYENKELWNIFYEDIIKKILPAFNTTELPEETLRVILDLPIGSILGLVPNLFNNEYINFLILKLNNID